MTQRHFDPTVTSASEKYRKCQEQEEENEESRLLDLISQEQGLSNSQLSASLVEFAESIILSRLLQEEYCCCDVEKPSQIRRTSLSSLAFINQSYVDEESGQLKVKERELRMMQVLTINNNSQSSSSKTTTTTTTPLLTASQILRNQTIYNTGLQTDNLRIVAFSL